MTAPFCAWVFVTCSACIAPLFVGGSRLHNTAIATSNRSSASGSGDLCTNGKSLIISYKQEEHTRGEEGLWLLQPGFENQVIVIKESVEEVMAIVNGKPQRASSNCTRTYTASCSKGMIITKMCAVWASPSVEYRCLGDGAGDCSFFTANSRGTDLHPDSGEHQMIIHDPRKGDLALESGRVSWMTQAMSTANGVELKRIPRGLGRQWSAPSGCYCCKHSYPVFYSPFCYMSSLNAEARVAWKIADGTQECMNAWEYVGDNMALFLPAFVYMFVDTLTLGITSDSACALACAGRDTAKFPEHSYYYKKSAISDDTCA